MTEVNASALYNIYIKPNKDFKLLQCFSSNICTTREYLMFVHTLELVHAMVN
ncbi:unnamed protein product [Brassica oleracea var. botrytis]